MTGHFPLRGLRQPWSLGFILSQPRSFETWKLRSDPCGRKVNALCLAPSARPGRQRGPCASRWLLPLERPRSGVSEGTQPQPLLKHPADSILFPVCRLFYLNLQPLGNQGPERPAWTGKRQESSTCHSPRSPARRLLKAPMHFLSG